MVNLFEHGTFPSDASIHRHLDIVNVLARSTERIALESQELVALVDSRAVGWHADGRLHWRLLARPEPGEVGVLEVFDAGREDLVVVALPE